MTDNTTLDAVIIAGFNARRASKGLCTFPKNRFAISDDDRTYARALLAKLLEGMEQERPDWFTTDEDCGWDAAISDLRLRVGLEYEV